MQGDYKNFLRMIIILSVLINILISQTLPKSNPVHTYSIIAYDPDTGEFGVAVQSHWFSVGSLVPWAKAGVGAVATQSFVKVEYGPDGLALMEEGKSAKEALALLIDKDEGRDVRQVAMIDNKGNCLIFGISNFYNLVDSVSSEISKLAEQFSNEVNEIQTSGIDLNGKSGKAMFSINSMLPQANFSNKAELKFNIIE